MFAIGWRIKRGGQFELTSLTINIGDAISDDQELGGISKALDELAHVDRSLSQIVDLKFVADFRSPKSPACKMCQRVRPQKMGKGAHLPAP
jgi:hypothetical protein